MFDLHGKVAVVTGASVGLGRGFAFAMARQGADVAILARRKEKLDQVRKKFAPSASSACRSSAM